MTPRRREMVGSPEESNEALVRTFFDALSRADVEALRELYADDFQLWTAGTLPFSDPSNKAQALEGMRGIPSSFSNGLEFSIRAMTAGGNASRSRPRATVSTRAARATTTSITSCSCCGGEESHS
jgi:ketosteroid isomerase-like protein